jgi:ParB family chromosome partitioning protein
MRHDAHYVEELATHHPTPIGRLIALDQLDPNPEQPRVEIGDLEDLTASIKEKGVLEPLLVKPSRITGRWMIIAGERRWRASKAAGLREVPCIEMEVDDRAVAEIALIENMQRKDLTAWEEADGLAALCERFGYTHEDVARKVGKSRSTVTEALSIASLPEVIREKCRRADIGAKSLLLQIVRQPHVEAMHDILEEITTQGLNRDGARAARRSKQEGKKTQPISTKAEPYVYTYEPEGGSYKLEVRFKSSEVELAEVAAALKVALNQLEETADSAASDND